MPNALSIDVEDYYHARNIELAIGRARWSSLESRVNYSTNLVLELLAKKSIKGTFFILGSVARKDKDLVKAIASSGHEIASHGFRHHLAYDQTPKAFYRDVCSSRKLLQDISGQSVDGYRAPNFSIRDQNLWAYSSLVEAGYSYDSSLYPVWHPRYDNRNKPTALHEQTTEKGKLVIAPLAVLPLGKVRLGIAGGAYWRIFPHFLIKFGLQKLNKSSSSANIITYLHPWELDQGQPVFEELGFLGRIRHYGGISGLANKIESHLERHSWVTIGQMVNNFLGGTYK